MHNHAFVRHTDPHFGLAFGGGCAEYVYAARLGWVLCGWPEMAHPTAPRPNREDRLHAGLELPCGACAGPCQIDGVTRPQAAPGGKA